MKGLALSALSPAVLAPRDAFHLIAAARLHPQKRLDIALRAVGVARKEVNVHLNVLGDGKEASSLQRLAAELGIANRATTKA